MASGISPATNRLVNVIVCLGAAVVIIGAMAKILHLSWADTALKVGLSTEALIFVVYAFLPPPDAGGTVVHHDKGTPALKSMDKMMADADITPVTMTKLSESFQKLGATVNNMSDLTQTVDASKEYAARSREAAQALASVKDAYVTTANSLASFNEASNSTKAFQEQMQAMTKNLSSMNAFYEKELADSTAHLKELGKFYSGLARAAESMQASAADAERTRNEIAALGNNLSKLNAIYGNMLTAMSTRG